MDIFAIIISVIFGVALGVFVFNIFKNKGGKNSESQALVLIQNQINEITRTLDKKLGESTQAIQGQFNQSARIIRDVTERLTKLDETNKQVVNFADQLKNLQDILKNPKQRGVLGEYYLENLLKNAFQPKDYEMQYKFKDGIVVDAILKVGNKIIPIDSKFSLENYNRILEETDPIRRSDLEAIFKQDLKKRIDETAKYIRPEEETTEFAFMFIPAEGIYYDLLINKIGAVKASTRDLIDYAINEKRVHIVSPTTFYVTLQSMWEGMRAYRIQESTKEILGNVSRLAKHLKVYNDYHNKIGTHLQTTVNTYNNSMREFGKVDKDILKIAGEGVGVEQNLLEGPKNEDE